MIRYLVFFLILISTVVYTQDPYHIQYGVEEGLPSEEIYDVYIDRNDVVWCTTDRGVSKYDGYSFVNSSTTDGLAVISILKF